MANSRATVLIIQPSQVQRVIWQQVLNSQDISVITESPDLDPVEVLVQIEQAGIPLPNLLLIDSQLPSWNPEAFCQWCSQNYPALKIIFLSKIPKKVSPSERQAMIDYGAFDLLPAFQVENLAIGVIVAVKRVLAALPGKQLQNDLLASSLIALKREIESSKLESYIQPLERDTTASHEQVNSASLHLKSSDSSESLPPSPPQAESSPTKTPKKRYRGATF